VIEIDGEIRGYLLGSRKTVAQPALFFLAKHFFFSKRSPAISAITSLEAICRWTLTYGGGKCGGRRGAVPHFHINLLPDARKMSTTRR